MTIDLLPGRGVRLPAPLPELRFGLSEAAVRALLAPHGELLPGGVHPVFVCGSRWALAFRLPGVTVTLSSGGGDGSDSDVLEGIGVGRTPDDDRSACPVGYLGIDVFGWPAHELAEALRAEGLPVPDPEHGTLRHTHLYLHRSSARPARPAPGRKPRHEAPYYFDYVSLHRTAAEAAITTHPTGSATGPHDAAFLPRLELSARPAERPITEPVPKLGGEPCWLAEPSWPLSPDTGEPMVFIGQFPVPGAEERLAYLFLAEVDGVMGGLDPEAGDGVLLVQPGGRIPPFAVIGPPGTRGRTLWRRDGDAGPGGDEPRGHEPGGAGPRGHEPRGDEPRRKGTTPVEFRLDLLPLSAEAHRSMDQRAAFQRHLRGEGPEVPFPDGEHVFDHLGGLPSFPSGRAGLPPPWRYFFALSDAREDDDPYFLNFGYGVGFGFLSPDGLEGRFCWQAT
ncbi:hypothetical protein ACFV1W_19515 [Kitasatospora sp. NPDC059648]|uniref:hypothetical protein n=1 Tax=Kitasatospora sp. NPDC059648 TaxID=3346894 RepID=UPI00367C4C96